MKQRDITQPHRVSPAYVHERMQRGHDLLLVCAYEDDEVCRQIGIEGATSVNGLMQREGTLDENRELVFYGRDPNDGVPVERAADYLRYYRNVKVMSGGFQAWADAGYPTVGTRSPR